MKPINLKRRQTNDYFLAYVSLGLSTAALGPALPYMAVQSGSKLSQISILIAVKAAGYLFDSAVGGRLYDRVRDHDVMFFGLLGVVLTMALIPVAPLLWLLSVILFFLGATEGAVDVGGNTLLIFRGGQRWGDVFFPG